MAISNTIFSAFELQLYGLGIRSLEQFFKNESYAHFPAQTWRSNVAILKVGHNQRAANRTPRLAATVHSGENDSPTTGKKIAKKMRHVAQYLLTGLRTQTPKPVRAGLIYFEPIRFMLRDSREILRDAVFLCSTPLPAPRIISG